jgi:hypothetical protein
MPFGPVTNFLLAQKKNFWQAHISGTVKSVENWPKNSLFAIQILKFEM